MRTQFPSHIRLAISQLKELRPFPLIISGGVGILMILSAASLGFIQNYFDSEEFYVFHYANNLSHSQAWQQFFLENGRLIEGIYWTYLYKIVGFNPILIHSLSFVLLLGLSIVAAACFLNIWPQQKPSQLLPYVFVFSLFVNWISAMAVFRISYDNTHMSMLFFFLSGIALQRWAAMQRFRWLLCSLLLFFASVITYENAIFLFPALILLAWPLVSPAKTRPFPAKVSMAVVLTGISGLILLLSRVLNSFSKRSSGAPGDIAEVLGNAIEGAPITYLRFGQFFEADLPNLTIGVGLLAIVLSAIYLLVFVNSSRNSQVDNQAKQRINCIVLACAWLLVFGPLPYILLGYSPGPRVYSSAIFGVFPLILIFYDIKARSYLRVISIALVCLFSIIGFWTLLRESTAFKINEAPLNIFFRGLINEVPHVRPHTVFIFINGPPFGIPGCGPSLEMLYAQQDIKCGSIRSTFDSYYLTCPVVRHIDALEVDCQHLDGGNWVFLSMEGDVPRLLDELKPGDFGLVMDWASVEPLRTDFQKIEFTEVTPTPFYLHLLSRADVLYGDGCAECGDHSNE